MAWSIFKKAKQREFARNPHLAVAQTLSDLLKKCPHCKRRLSGHKYARFATWVVPKEEDGTLLAFFKAIKDHDWTKLQELQRWDPLGDDVEAFAVRCPTHGFSVVVIKTHFELFLGSPLLLCETLLAGEGEKLLAAFPFLEWHTF